MLRALILFLVVAFGQALRPCTRHEACGLTENSYADPVTTEMPNMTTTEGSGEGSGEGEEVTVEPLMYDHLAVPNDSAFPDEGEEPSSKKNVTLCTCANSVECSFEDENRTISLDPFLNLHFCVTPKEQFPRKCRGKRAGVRVFGKIDPEMAPDPILTRTMANYTETKVYCHCPEGRSYKKSNRIESWSHGLRHAFMYNC